MAKYVFTHGKYFLLGDDLEEFNFHLAEEVEKSKRIIYGTDFTHSPFERGQEYTIWKGAELYEALRTARTLDDITFDLVTVRLWEEENDGRYSAEKTKAVFIISDSSLTELVTDLEPSFISFYVKIDKKADKQEGLFDVNTKQFHATF